MIERHWLRDELGTMAERVGLHSSKEVGNISAKYEARSRCGQDKLGATRESIKHGDTRLGRGHVRP